MMMTPAFTAAFFDHFGTASAKAYLAHDLERACAVMDAAWILQKEMERCGGSIIDALNSLYQDKLDIERSAGECEPADDEIPF